MAGVSSSLHFIGKEQVMQAYRNRQIPAWSLWCGKQFLTKGMDEVELESFLAAIWEGSTATYTLRVYDGIDNVKDVKEKTECDGSFNFRLVQREDDYVPGTAKGRIEQRQIELEEKFDALLQKLSEPVEEEKEPETIGKVFMGILQDPEKLERTIGTIKNLIGMVTPPPMPHQIGNVSFIQSEPEIKATMTTQQKELNKQQLTRLYGAIEKLTKADTGIVEHMEKLAMIAERNPAQFKVLLSMLETFK